IIAGEAMGQQAVTHTRIPITYLHLTLQPGATHVQPLPPESHAFA
ncbi:MAG: pirin family protein, partial [Gammaproteobacteria bacterium]|nr:pirin family protein [Gammaproteobacteria bacterium]